MRRAAALCAQLASTPAAGEGAGGAGQGVRALETAPFPPCASDYLGLDALLGEQEREVRARVRAFMEREVAPIANEFWERAEFPHQLVPRLRSLGLAGAGLGRGHGLPGLSHMCFAMIMLEMTRVDPSVATFFTVHCGLAMNTIAQCGSEEQKQRWLPAMARLELVGAWGLTEPNFGSDATAIQTTAVRDAARGGWVLNGAKRWIGNASFADLIVIWARNAESGELSGFVVEKGSPGYSATPTPNKIALRTVQNGDIVLKDVFVPDRNRLANGDGFARGPGRVLSSSRILVAWKPVGASMGIYDNCLRYVRQRHAFGAPIGKFQLVQEKLVRMLGNIQAMALLAWRVSSLAERGQMTDGQSAMAKAWNTLRGREVAALGREILGGNGIVLDYHVARLFCDMEAIYTYEGTYEVNSLVCGREVTGLAAIKPAK
jgi:acyl-CoA oxidase